MATLNVHKTAKPAAISCLAADVPAAQGGAAAPRCILAPRWASQELLGGLRSLSSCSALASSVLSRREASTAERTPRCLLRKHTGSDLGCHRLISLSSNGSCRFLLLPKASFKLVRKVQARGIFVLCILILTAQDKCR